MEKQISRIKRIRKYQGTVLDVYQDEMHFANGNTEKWDYIHHKGAAAILPVLNDGRMILVRQYRNAVDRFTWELPAGGLESPEESGRACALRELEEETGYRAGNIEKLLSIRTTVALSNEKIDVFVAKNLIKTSQNLDENEFVEIEFFNVDEVKEMIFAGEIEDSKTISAVLAYDALSCRNTHPDPM